MCGVYGRNAFASAHKAAQANVVDLPSRREKEENIEAVRIDCVAPFCCRQLRFQPVLERTRNYVSDEQLKLLAFCS